MKKRLLFCVIIINLAATQCMPMAAIRSFLSRHTPMVLHAVKKAPTVLAYAARNHKVLTASLALASTVIAIPQARRALSRGINSALLCIAAQQGYAQMVKILLKTGNDINQQDFSGMTALHRAAEQGQRALVESLLAHGADLNIVDNSDKTALYLAARHGHRAVVALLLARGADINQQSAIGMTALHDAALRGHQAVVVSLVSHGADIALRTIANGRAEDFASTQEIRSYLRRIPQLAVNIQAAVERGDITAVQQLVAQGAPVITLGQDGNTLIHRVIRDYNPKEPTVYDKIARILIHAVPYQASHARNRDGQTPLHNAAACGNTRIARYLLSHGADVNAQDGRGNTPLHRFRTKRMRDLLLEYHADPKLMNREGQVPMVTYPDAWYDLLAAQAQQ